MSLLFQVDPSPPPKHPRTSTSDSTNISSNLNKFGNSSDQTSNDLKPHPKEVKRKQTDKVTGGNSWKHERQSEGSTVSSREEEDKPKRTCPFYKKVPGIKLLCGHLEVFF